MSEKGTRAGVVYPVRPKGVTAPFWQIAPEGAPRPVCGRLDADGALCRGPIYPSAEKAKRAAASMFDTVRVSDAEPLGAPS